MELELGLDEKMLVAGRGDDKMRYGAGGGLVKPVSPGWNYLHACIDLIEGYSFKLRAEVLEERERRRQRRKTFDDDDDDDSGGGGGGGVNVSVCPPRPREKTRTRPSSFAKTLIEVLILIICVLRSLYEQRNTWKASRI